MPEHFILGRISVFVYRCFVYFSYFCLRHREQLRTWSVESWAGMVGRAYALGALLRTRGLPWTPWTADWSIEILEVCGMHAAYRWRAEGVRETGGRALLKWIVGRTKLRRASMRITRLPQKNRPMHEQKARCETSSVHEYCIRLKKVLTLLDMICGGNRRHWEFGWHCHSKNVLQIVQF